MNKILLGLSILLSIVLLSGCGSGSSGSKGADGAAGAAGADGADGTDGSASGSITAFTDADVKLYFNGAAGAVPGGTPTAVPLDNGSAVGTITGMLTVENADNITRVSSPNRYYLYELDDDSVARHLRPTSNDATYEEWEGPFNPMYHDVSADDGILDTRFLISQTTDNNTPHNSDNLTITLLNWDMLSPGTDGVDFNTAAFLVCPGNDGGDSACSKVLAPHYDRGVHHSTASALGKASNYAGDTLNDVKVSLASTGGDFQAITDNSSGDAGLKGAVYGFRVADNKTSHGSTFTVVLPDGIADNSSATHLSTADNSGSDNHTRVSNLLARTRSDNSSQSVWFAMSYDNDTVIGGGTGSDGDNVSLGYRTHGGANFIDNGSKVSHNTLLTTSPQIAEAGDGVYIMLGSGTTVATVLANDNTTNETMDTTTVGTANTWCSTSNGSTLAVIISDNSSASGTAGLYISKVWGDNGTSESVSTTATSGHTNLEQCAATYSDSTYYVALTDETGGNDNVSVWKSTDLSTWTQIGEDYTILGDAASIAIAAQTDDGTASDGAVWVAVNAAGTVQLLHYEDIAGGTDKVWRSVSSLFTGAATSAEEALISVAIASDNSSVIAVGGVVSSKATMNIWYDQ